jgi:putative endopeptidase
MKRRLLALLISTTLVPPLAFSQSSLRSGIALENVDPAVRPQDQLYLHTNGHWLETTAVPADKGRYDTFDELNDAALSHLREIVEALPATHPAAGSDARKIGDLYADYMDEAAIEAQGLKPLQPVFDRIEALRSAQDIPALIAHFNRIGVSAPLGPQVHQDAKDPSKYVFDLVQDGLGLPDRDYYLETTAPMQEIRSQYLTYMASMLGRAGDRDASVHAHAILALETQLAQAQWTRLENRDVVKSYNKYAFTQLHELMPDYNWSGYLQAAGIKDKVDYLLVSQPSYLRAVNELLRTTPLDTWKLYFRWHALSDCSLYLGKDWMQDRFAFYSTALRGVAQMKPRWKRGIILIEDSMGESLGKLYVAKYFPPVAKQRADTMIQNLLAAFRLDVDTLDWMGDVTKGRAKEKLALFMPKIGYPTRWRDYHTLQVTPGHLLANVISSQTFEYRRNLNKFGHPIDRTEWPMTPQTINAYYNPEQNEIVFPAGVLQPPFFDATADDAVNYGAIGGLIGHEISHGFDDQGSQYDGHGKLLDAPGWFTAEDLARFKAKTAALVAQYSAFEAAPGIPLSGALTLGENIGDNSGLAIAYKAYQLSLHGAAAPVIDGLTGDQRFFLGWAQAWRSISRDKYATLYAKLNVHSPDAVRGFQPERNMDAFYAAFDVQPTDAMYLAPEKRVRIW